ncbi:hypothetical protein PYCC9005_005690 [Savitreella phatthalungensis]
MFRTTDNIGELREKIDVKSLEQYLSHAAPAISHPLKLNQFLHGQSNPTILLTDAKGLRYVLRKKPPGELISQTAHAVEREYRIMKALEKTDVPVPQMFCLCEDKAVIGTPFYVMQFLEGRIFTNPALRVLSSEEERRACWMSAVETISKIHRVVPKDVGLDGYGRATGFYERQLRTFDKLCPLQASAKDADTGEEVGDIPHWPDMQKWFKQHTPQDRSTIVHGDFKMDNCVFHPSEARVIGVLDWELSTIGHPLSDLANLLQPHCLPSGADSSLTGFKGLDDLGGVPTAAEVLKHYASLTGYDPAVDWTFGEAFAHLRLAVITQGIAARVARKQASSLKAKTHAQMFVPLGYLGWQTIEDASEPSSKL